MVNIAVLYVEDEENDVLLLQIAFQHAGITNPFKVVGDGKQAMEYLAGHGPYSDRHAYPFPCLVLLDINLPLKSGFDVLCWMRGDPSLRKIPVIMFTSSSQPQDIEKAYAMGANAYIIKSPSSAEWQKGAAAIRDFWLTHNTPPLACLHAGARPIVSS